MTLGLGSLSPERLKYASGLFNMMRNLGGAVGIAVCGAILNNRTNSHFLDIATHLTPANGAMEQLLHGMAARWGAALGGPVAGHAAALSQLWHLAYREASTLAYADAFRAIMVAFVIATMLVPLLRKVAPPKAAAGRSALTRLRLTSEFGIDGSGFAIKKGPEAYRCPGPNPVDLALRVCVRPWLFAQSIGSAGMNHISQHVANRPGDQQRHPWLLGGAAGHIVSSLSALL